MSTNTAVPPQPTARRSPLAGSALLIADVSCPLGLSIARRIAAEAMAPVCVSSDPKTASGVDDEIARVRDLNGLEPALPVLHVDLTTDAGAIGAVAAVKTAYDRIDAAVIALRPGAGSPAAALGPLLPLLRASTAAMASQPAGKILLALDLGSASGATLSAAARARLDAAFETLVRATARVHFKHDLCVNGLLVDPREDAGDHALLLAGGAPINGAASTVGKVAAARAAAAGVVSMLASQTGCGITGQVFRIGSAPPEPRSAPDMAAFIARSVPLP